MLGEWGKELWEEGRELVVLALIPGPKHAWKRYLVPGAAVHQVKSQN